MWRSTVRGTKASSFYRSAGSSSGCHKRLAGQHQEDNDEVFEVAASCFLSEQESGFVFATVSHIVRYQRRSADPSQPALMRQLWMLAKPAL